MTHYLGIDIGGTKCAVLRGDEAGRVISKIRFDTTTPEETLDRIYAAADRLIAEGRASDESPIAIGVSCGSPLDSRAGIIKEPPNLPGWVDVPITAELTRRTGLPAFLCNDANACALAEWRFGAGRGTSNMIFLTFGTGMGAGLILDGRLYRGTTDDAGECGHMRLAADGPVGYRKAGSFEGFCSGGGIAQLARSHAEKAIACGLRPAYCPSLSDLPSVTAKSVAEAAYAGDATALAVWEDCGTHLGRALAILVDVLNPERIVIGSIFARSGNLLIPAMQAALERDALAPSLAACSIVPAALAESVGDLAALTIAIEGIRS